MVEELEYVRLGAAIEAYVRDGGTLAPPRAVSATMKRQAGALSRCIARRTAGLYRHHRAGAGQPGQEIIANAISAATRDPRFSPLRPDELADLEMSVDVLNPPSRRLAGRLDQRIYGVIVAHAGGGAAVARLEGWTRPSSGGHRPAQAGSPRTSRAACGAFG
jgi:AMMECR1 domain-containing protein